MQRISTRACRVARNVEETVASNGGTADPPTPRVSASFSWGDYDADGLIDAFVISAGGSGSLLRNLGDGSFENVTERVGLMGATSHTALWSDFDGDGKLDLFLADYEGESRLLRQSEGQTFEDVTVQSGLSAGLRPIDAEWIDYDADGLLDIYVSTYGADVYQKLAKKVKPATYGVEALRSLCCTFNLMSPLRLGSAL